MPDILVNYRTADSRFGAAATYELLSKRFGKRQLFLDNQSISPGAHYVSELNRILESIRVLLVLIGPAWLMADPEFPTQLLVERDDDWVRREIKRSLEREVHVIPVLIDGASLPEPTLLPPDIQGLVWRQAVEVRHNHLGEDVARLGDYLATLMPVAAEQEAQPRQLPMRPGRLVGRAEEIAQLSQFALGSARTAVLCGAPGVGKTTLATHWAHQTKDRFPDGQLHVNLRGFDSRAAVDPSEALHGFLIALGLPPEAISDTLDTRAALYRSSLAGRRVLILLDNACSAEQVRPLLPGTQSCLVLVTSRTRLQSLAVREGAVHITLDLLPEPDAHLLLTERLRSERLAAEPDTAGELLQWCAGLPLALCLVGALVDQRPGPLSQVVRELGAERNRLDALELGADDLDLRTVFSWSYQRLSPASRRLFRLLGLHPGPDISRESCVALCQDRSPRRVLDELVRANLVTEHLPGRLGLHDLLRVYAAEQAYEDASEMERHAALQRITDHYSTLLAAAAYCLDPNQPDTVQDEQAFGGYQDAMAWCVAESAVILAIVDLAARHGFDEHVWRMASRSNAFLRRTGRRWQRVDVHKAAVAAATRAGDKLAGATANRELASALARLGRQDEASTHLAAALPVFETAGDRYGLLQTHLSYTRVLEAQGDYENALEHARKALALARGADDAVSHADALIYLGIQLTMLRRYNDALPVCTDALDRYERLDHVEGQANCLLTIGMIHQGREEYTAASACYERSSAMDQRLGDRYWEAISQERLGEVYELTGQPDRALRHWQTALDILDSLCHPEATRLRDRTSRAATLQTASGPCAEPDPGHQ